MGRNGSRPPKREVSKARRRQKNRPRPQPRVETPRQPGPRAVPAPSGAHPSEHVFPVVGVGASAGGLEAFSQLLRNLPSDTGMAFVLVQHLAAKHQSILASILARETKMSVQEAAEGMPLRPNHVYVIPPGQDMLVKDGHLGLQPRGLTDGRHLPFDLFLRTLADAHKSQSVAVVLSGTGNDGTLGCMAVKAAGGISFAQDPRSARYDGMPRSAIAAGCVDLVLPPDEIAREIQRLSGAEYLRRPAESEVSPAPDEDGKDAFARILGLLRKGTGTDFSSYKKPTLMRRLRRRMALWKIEQLGDYVGWLVKHPGELDALHQDFLINVTTFFRDPAAFAVLANDICPRLLHQRSGDSPVRVWIPGCANGEEAYSIAICLLEAVGRTGATPSIQIFGTDLSSAAILRARAGVYLESIAADVSPARLERFFVKVDGSYQVSKALRDMCVFAQHNLIRDPPFSRLDLVSCRNLLIYLEAPQQQRVLSSFHYALKPTGFLLLGHSETVGATRLFDPVDKEQRVYTKKLLFPAPPVPSAASKDAGAKASRVREAGGEQGWLHREADRATLNRYAPAGVLVELQSINEELETAKEELQSANEELTTVNEELQNRNLELTRATDDMVNLLASLDVPIVMLGSDRQVRRFTPAAARLFNLIPGDVGRPLADLRGSIVMSDLEPSIRAAMDTLAVQTKEVTDKDGRWYSMRVRPYKTAENRIDGVVMLFVDIDELKKGAQRLDQSRAYAEAIVDTVGSPLLILNTRLRVERANRCYYEMFRTSPEETEGQALSELGGGLWDVADLRRRLADLPVSQGELAGVALGAEVPGKGMRTMLMNARRLTLDGPGPARILVSIEDRTEEVRALRDREALLAQEELATRQAQMASRLKDEFIATVSHELRGPLNAMAGWVHALGSGRLEPETVSRGLAALDRAVKSQTRLIEDLLDMSRIMSGKLRLAHRFIDLAEVTRAALETAAPAAQAKSIQMAFQSQSEPLFVLGDPDRLQQVVWNLLSNAVKFTPRDGRVDVELLRKGTSTQLRVTDSGQGISPDFLPHVFEPFRQADSSPARSHQGLGLGLAISRHLVESHGGIIRAESAGLGQGTTVIVLLPVPPLIGTTSSSEQGQHDAPPPVVPDRSLLEGLRVLIVEDEADSRDILAAVLREWGADVTTSASAPDALVVLESRPPDVLVSDIGMPGMDGYELIRELRKRDAAHGGRVPAIALTAYADQDSRSQVFSAGFEEHMAKPADPQALLAAVARLAGRRIPLS